MPRQITIELSDEQYASISLYVESQVEWVFDTSAGRISKRRWETVEDYISETMARVLEGPLTQFPGASVSAKRAQIAALQQEISAAAKPNVRTK
jgi:hypothetical protein